MAALERPPLLGGYEVPREDSAPFGAGFAFRIHIVSAEVSRDGPALLNDPIAQAQSAGFAVRHGPPVAVILFDEAHDGFAVDQARELFGGVSPAGPFIARPILAELILFYGVDADQAHPRSCDFQRVAVDHTPLPFDGFTSATGQRPEYLSGLFFHFISHADEDCDHQNRANSSARAEAPLPVGHCRLQSAVRLFSILNATVSVSVLNVTGPGSDRAATSWFQTSGVAPRIEPPDKG